MYLVKKIIDKCEKSASDWREGASGGRTMRIEQADYDNEGKSAVIDEVLRLEEQGLFTRVKWLIRGSDAERVSYLVEDLPRFYELWRLEQPEFVPKQEKILVFQKQIQKELEEGFHKGWITDYYRWMQGRLERGELPRDLEKLKIYIPSLRGIDSLEEPVFKRIFSKKWLGNSKIFEKEAEDHIITLARTYCQEIDEGMDGKTVLSQLYIEEYAQELAVKGPLKIVLSGRSIDLSAFIYGTVLNSETLKHCVLCEEQTEIRRVITIENKANFVSAAYEPHTLYVFSHGYFSPKEREFLIKLREILKKDRHVEYYHSGDLDYGGIRIFEYIRKRIFPDVKPLYMNADILEQYKMYTERIGESTKQKLADMEVSAEMSALKEKILKSGCVLEQEIIFTV